MVYMVEFSKNTSLQWAGEMLKAIGLFQGFAGIPDDMEFITYTGTCFIVGLPNEKAAGLLNAIRLIPRVVEVEEADFGL